MSKIQYSNQIVQKLKSYIGQTDIFAEMLLFEDDVLCFSAQKGFGSAKSYADHLARLILSKQVSWFLWSQQQANDSDQPIFKQRATNLGVKEGLTVIHDLDNIRAVCSLACSGDIESFKQAFLQHHIDIKLLVEQIVHLYRARGNTGLKDLIDPLFAKGA